MPEVVSHYGLHDAGGIWFLEQEGGGKTALPISVASPFRVRSKLPCPHGIRVPRQTSDEVLPDHPLITVMSPVPTPHRVYFLRQQHAPAVAELTRLCSPTASICHPVWSQQLRTLANLLQVTNVAPLVLTGLGLTHLGMTRKLVQAALISPRRLVLVGDDTAIAPAGAKVIDAPVLTGISDLPLEELGAQLLTEWMTNVEAA
jgi:hypothetical protein